MLRDRDKVRVVIRLRRVGQPVALAEISSGGFGRSETVDARRRVNMHTSRSKLRRGARVSIAGVASLALLGSAPVMDAFGSTAPDAKAGPALAATATGSSKAVDIPAGVKFYQKRTSLLGVHKWYQQMSGGNPVFGGWWGFHRNSETGEVTIDDQRVAKAKANTSTPKVSSSVAARAASGASKVAPTGVTSKRLMVLPMAGGARLTWAVDSFDARGSRITFVDAVTGKVLKKVVTSDKARTTGRARTFAPNPIQKLQNENLTDQNDSATAVPAKGYSMRNLARLNGEGRTLVGQWAKVMNKNRVTSPNAVYKFNRKQEGFEQVMAYYSIDVEENYLQNLGFTDANAEQQKIETNTITIDNSFYNPGNDKITMGSGGVDDAEDPEVIWHENGHAIQDDQVPNWGQQEEGGAMGEAFGDYMAVTMSQAYGDGTTKVPTACVMDWDATSYTSTKPHCLRRTDGDKIYPDDMDGEVHDDGEIWSRALWDMNVALGRNKATKIIVEAQFWMNPNIGFQDGAAITVQAAQMLYPSDPTVADATYQAFQDRGILPAPPA